MFFPFSYRLRVYPRAFFDVNSAILLRNGASLREFPQQRRSSLSWGPFWRVLLSKGAVFYIGPHKGLCVREAPPPRVIPERSGKPRNLVDSAKNHDKFYKMQVGSPPSGVRFLGYAPNPKPQTLNPKPQTLNPKP